jgi:hypothetical protein
MTPGDPESEAYARLMYGRTLLDAARLAPAEEQRCQEEYSQVWERLLHRAGVTKLLAAGQDLGWRGGTPHRGVRTADGRTSDLVRLVPWVLRDKVAGDVMYEGTARRAPQVTSGRGLEQGDAASLRFRSLNSQTADGAPLPTGVREREVERFLELRAMLAMYTAAPHFVPPAGAFDAATGLPPEPGAQLRLTSEAVLIFHDGIPLPAVLADDDALNAHAASHFGAEHDGLFAGGPLVMGGIVLAHPDDGTEEALLLNPLVGWLVIANRIHGEYAWAMHAVHRLDTNPGPAARVLRNYAALNALEGWDTPPRIPGQARPRGKGKQSRLPAPERRRQQLELAARTPQARQGALLGVRVLTFTAPPHEAAPPPPPPPPAAGTSRGSAQFREWRRAHWTRNTRVHLLDADGPSPRAYRKSRPSTVPADEAQALVKSSLYRSRLVDQEVASDIRQWMADTSAGLDQGPIPKLEREELLERYRALTLRLGVSLRDLHAPD